MFDYKSVREKLSLLHQAAKPLKGWDQLQAEKFIKVGEYDLALDSIACAYLANNTVMPTHLARVFDKLATDMDLASDPEYSAVAELRKAQGAP